MRISWAQPSLSRDFVLLSAAVLFVLVLISGWVTYRTYERHYERIAVDLGKEAARIEATVSTEMEKAGYMLSSIGRQIVVSGKYDSTELAQLLKSFDSKNYIYSLLSWTHADGKMIISSNKGVLDEPVDISDRDFIKESLADSWKMHIGRPIDGRVSGRWVIPASMGITDYTGKFVGVISLSIDIEVLTEQIKNLVKRDGISFAVVTKDFTELAEVSDGKGFLNNYFPGQKLAGIDFDKKSGGLLDKGSLLWGSGIYTYYLSSEKFPYIILMGYDSNYSDETVRMMLWSRLLQIASVAVFFVFFLWIVRARVIGPVLNITSAVTALARGEPFSLPHRKNSSLETEALITQLARVGKYIDETKRIESELRNKMFALKKSQENAELNMRSKSEFLAYIAQEMRLPINNIIGFSQVLKDQTYGAIENKKYRQYSNDIFMLSNLLISRIQDILNFSKIESGYVDLQEKTLEIPAMVNTAIRQVTDKLHVANISIKVNLHEPLPRLRADEFRIQQVLINLLLMLADNISADDFISLDVRAVNEPRDKRFLAIIIADSSYVPLTASKLSAAAEEIFVGEKGEKGEGRAIAAKPHPRPKFDLRFELAQTLVAIHGGIIHTENVDDDIRCYVIILPASRLAFYD